MAEMVESQAGVTDAPGASRPLVAASHLTKTYGTGASEVHALSNVSFNLWPGEFVVVLGPSGSGKTTLLNLVGALEAPTSGTLRMWNRVVGELDEQALTRYRLESIAFVFQFFNLIPTLTAFENVALLAEYTGPRAEERARTVLEQVGLGDRQDHFPAQLSGGEQQRVAIARGLVKGASLVLCDEPTGSLDVETGRRVLRVLRDVADDGDRSVVTVTHNAVIARMADRVLRLRGGAIVADEPNSQPLAPEALDW